MGGIDADRGCGHFVWGAMCVGMHNWPMANSFHWACTHCCFVAYLGYLVLEAVVANASSRRALRQVVHCHFIAVGTSVRDNHYVLSVQGCSVGLSASRLLGFDEKMHDWSIHGRPRPCVP